MDKDLLRIVIVIIGVMVTIGVVLWSAFKHKKPQQGIDFDDQKNPLDNINKPLILDSDNDDFDIVLTGSALDNDLSNDGLDTSSDELPSLIQFSIVSPDDSGFNGKVLSDAFQQVGLEYGLMKVFEHLDDKRRVNFAVANMVEPGTFPANNMESFYCPGIVFFLQSAGLENPLSAFDNFIQIINLLATELDGDMRDHNRQVLTDETIQKFRMKLINLKD